MTEPNPAAAALDMRPVVARPTTNRGVWIFVGVMTIAAVGLFSALEARRGVITSPATAIPSAGSTSGVIAPPPTLAIPPEYPAYPGVQPYPTAALGPPPALIAPPPVVPARRTQTIYMPPPSGAMPAAAAAPLPPVPGFAYRGPLEAPPSPLKAENGEATGSSNNARAQASRLANPSTTVPQGTLIQAVLETALDSNRAGFARAVVSRDVTGFDGSRVLIPKGSRLFGEYKADLAPGQNRALIEWRRLTRPDGGIIDVASPSADPVGRAGVKGKVNSHFFARFSGAILQSALNIGESAANRSVSGDTFYFGATNNTISEAVRPRTENIKPTLTLKQGSSVSVFVGRDLDFTAIEP